MLKDKIVTPRVFWSSIAILAVLCVCLYALEEQEKSGRKQAERELGRAVAAKKVIEIKLIDAQKEIAARDEQIKTALDKLEKETAARKDAETKLQAAVGGNSAPNVELEKIVVKPEATTP